MIKLDRLKTQLQTSGIQEKNPALFQVINQLIDAVRQFQILTGGQNEVVVVNLATIEAAILMLRTQSYLTENDETSDLVNSRMLLAGTGITFDITAPGVLTINGIASGGSDWDVLTDGDLIEPELIFSMGEVIMVEIP